MYVMQHTALSSRSCLCWLLGRCHLTCLRVASDLCCQPEVNTLDIVSSCWYASGRFMMTKCKARDVCPRPRQLLHSGWCCTSKAVAAPVMISISICCKCTDSHRLVVFKGCHTGMMLACSSIVTTPVFCMQPPSAPTVAQRRCVARGGGSVCARSVLPHGHSNRRGESLSPSLLQGHAGLFTGERPLATHVCWQHVRQAHQRYSHSVS